MGTFTDEAVSMITTYIHLTLPEEKGIKKRELKAECQIIFYLAIKDVKFIMQAMVMKRGRSQATRKATASIIVAVCIRVELGGPSMALGKPYMKRELCQLATASKRKKNVLHYFRLSY